jgi:putative membrane protein
MLDGFVINTPATLIIAGLLLGVVNAIVRPFALLLSLPALLFTLGLFLLVINAAMIGLVALMLPGFQIAGFWTAVGGSLIVSLVSWIGSWFIGSRGRVEVIRHK